MRLGFYQPDIPQNLGAAVRLSACFGLFLDVIEPCGFPLTDKSLRRTALDYGGASDITRHPGWSSYRSEMTKVGSRIVLFSTSAEIRLEDFEFQRTDALLFGRESAGVPESVRREVDHLVRIPLHGDARSLNVVVSAGIASWEALRQTNGLPGG